MQLVEDITEEEKKEYLGYKSYKDVIANYHRGMQSIDEMINVPEQTTLLAGAMIAFDKGLSGFINEFSKIETNLYFLSEVTAQYRRYTDLKIKCPHICTPHLLSKEMVIRGMDIPISEEICRLVESKKYLKEASCNFRMRYPDLGKDYEICWAYYAYLYLFQLLEKIKPKKVILWNEFYAFHIIFQGICMEKKIPIEYMEFGCIPGTICIEGRGQQGESHVAVNWIKYKYSPTTLRQRQDARKVLDYLYVSRLNRNVQPKTTIQDLVLQNYDKNKRTVLFLGQNDSEAGMQPYTMRTKKYHSPVFASTIDAMEYIKLLAIKNNWNLIFKVHPTMSALGFEVEDKDKVNVVDNVDINTVIDFSDLVITILSQGAYISLIRHTPVLMLGYTQLKHKGCVYEAYSKQEIENKIKKALKKGYTDRQERAMEKHTAILLRHYLYDDGQEKERYIGQSLESYKHK